VFTGSGQKSELNIAEVERARKLIEESLRGYKITNVDAKEDKIVYTGGTNHEDFVSCLPISWLGSSLWPGERGNGKDDRRL
jgi:hypothetical protein